MKKITIYLKNEEWKALLKRMEEEEVRSWMQEILTKAIEGLGKVKVVF